uniref:Uncharacterized protein n=1 Tax=viral metagenome TaxID=1070528 RepID=A0A6C0E1K4_9ZZZZ
MNKSDAEPTIDNISVPDEFYRLIGDFIDDIMLTFPEYEKIIQRWWKKNDYSDITDSELKETSMNENIRNVSSYVFKHCMKIFPERFFDILYKNTEIFSENSEVNTEFLPGIVFKQLWLCDISEHTRETIWKYLQLILFSVIGSVHNTSELGDTAKLFEAINEDELKAKLEETLNSMHNLFSDSEDPSANANDTHDDTKSNINIPTAEEIHQHINGMMEGKLGKLAMELAEETAQDLNLDMDNVTSTQDVFKKLFSNPGKLMSMVKNIGGKIDTKIKSGEIKESELISESVELLNKMKGMPGMENMKDIFSKLGVPGVGKSGKINTGAMEKQLQKNLKMAQMKERMRNKVNNKASTTPTQPASVPLETTALTDEQIISIFSTGEKVEKTPRGAKFNETSNKKKGKHNKK